MPHRLQRWPGSAGTVLTNPRRFSGVMVWEVVPHDTRTSDAPAYS